LVGDEVTSLISIFEVYGKATTLARSTMLIENPKRHGVRWVRAGGIRRFGERFHEPPRITLCAPEPERNADLLIGLFQMWKIIKPIRRSAFRFMGRESLSHQRLLRCESGVSPVPRQPPHSKTLARVALALDVRTTSPK
jgi:hypothetical protein